MSKYNFEGRKRWTLVGGSPRASGKTFVILKCPFCQCDTKAYVWSLAGDGKICHTNGCGAKFARYGYSTPLAG